MTINRILTILLFIMVIMAVLLLSYRNITASVIQESSFTRAFCNSSNFCQDYEIKCSSNKVESISPITGAVIQQSKDWKDPREENASQNLCDYSQ